MNSLNNDLKEKSLLVYTFGTFPEIDYLKMEFSDIFIFGRLKEDFNKLTKIIDSGEHRYVIGIANSPAKTSIMESSAVNKFNENMISNTGESKYRLYIPESVPFQVSKVSTSSFCNWTAYKISEYIDDNKIPTKLMFIHVVTRELERLTAYIRTLR